MHDPFPWSKLLETPDNPAPPGGRVALVTTADGVVLRTASWPARRHPARGTILLLQGRAEFIEKYNEVIGELLARGFAVATFDWRGQGGSARRLADGRRGHVRHFSEFRLDVEAVAVQVLQPLGTGPVCCLAHSMGGCIALTGAAEGWLPAERLVATAPMVALSLVKRGGLVRRVVRILARLGLAERLVPGGVPHSISTEPFPGNRLSWDERRYRRNAAAARMLGPGAVGSPTIGWLNAAYEAMARFQDAAFGRSIRIPVLVLGAGDDPVCATPAAALFAGALGEGAFVPLPESRHEILMERDPIRAAFWRAFDAFVPTEGEPGSAAQPLQDLGMEPPVAAGDDGAARGR